jgi:hypothetical protein
MTEYFPNQDSDRLFREDIVKNIQGLTYKPSKALDFVFKNSNLINVQFGQKDTTLPKLAFDFLRRTNCLSLEDNKEVATTLEELESNYHLYSVEEINEICEMYRNTIFQSYFNQVDETVFDHYGHTHDLKLNQLKGYLAYIIFASEQQNNLPNVS